MSIELESGCSLPKQNVYNEPDCYNARMGRKTVGNLKFYPTPNEGIFKVEIPNIRQASLSIINALRQEVYQKSVEGNTTEKINLPWMDSGVYFLSVRNQDYVFNRRLVVE